MANTSITEFGGYEDEINALNKKIEELEAKLKSLKHTMETLKSSDLGMVGLMSQFNEYKDQIDLTIRKIQEMKQIQIDQVEDIGIEMKKFATSQTFDPIFKSINENLSSVVEKVDKMREVDKNLSIDGQATVSLWKQLGKSLFSWQSILTVGIPLLIDYKDKIVDWGRGILGITDVLKDVKKYNSELNNSIVSEQLQIDILFEKLKNAEIGSIEYKKAKDIIINSYGKYLDGLNAEVRSLSDVETAYKAVSEAAMESAKVRAVATATKSASDKYADLYTTRIKDIRNLFLQKYGNKGEGFFETFVEQFDFGKNVNFSKGMNVLIEKFNMPEMGAMFGGKAYVKSISNKLKSLIDDIVDGRKVMEKEIDYINKSFGLLGVQNSFGAAEKEYKGITDSVDTALKEIKRLKSEIQDIRDEKVTFSSEDEALAAIKEKEKEIEKFHSVLKAFTGTSYAERPEKNLPKQLTEVENEYVVENPDRSENTRVIDKQRADAKELFADLLKKYQDFTAQREDIERTYNEDIKFLEKQRTSDNSDIIDRAIAQAKKEKRDDLSALSFNEFKEELNFSDTFKNLNKISIESIDSLLQKMERLKGAAAQNLNADNLNEYMEALNKLRAESLDRQNNWTQIFGGIPELIEQRIRLQQEYNKAEEWAIEATEKKRNVELELAIATENLNSYVERLTGEQTDLNAMTDEYIEQLIRQKGIESGLAEEQIVENIQSFKDSVSDVRLLADSFSAAGRESEVASDMFKKAGDALTVFRQNTGNSISIADMGIKGVRQTVQGIQQVTVSFKEMLEAVGNETSIDTGIGKFGEFMNLVSEFSQHAGNAWENLKSGNIVGAVGETISGIVSLIKNIAQWKDKKKELNIEKMQDQIDSLSLAYDHLGNSLEKAFGGSAKNLLEEQNRLLEQQKTLVQNQMKEEESKKYTDDDRIKEMREQIYELDRTIEDNKDRIIEAIFGEDVQSAISNFADAYVNAWSAGEDKAASLKVVLDNMVRNAVVKMIEDDMSKGVEGVMEKISSALYGSTDKRENRGRIRYNVSSGDKKIDEKEWNSITSDLDTLYEYLEKQYSDPWFDKILSGGEEVTSQGSNKSGFETMSQDTGAELNGRFTALQISGENILLQTGAQTELIGLLNTNVGDIRVDLWDMRNIADEVRTIQVNSYLELQEIRQNTGSIIKPIQKIAQDIEEVKMNTKSLIMH